MATNKDKHEIVEELKKSYKPFATKVANVIARNDITVRQATDVMVSSIHQLEAHAEEQSHEIIELRRQNV